MARRIVCCNSCRKRFTTRSGSTLCLSCRPKEAPPELTYGGDSLSLPPSSKRRDANACSPEDHRIKADNSGEGENSNNDANNFSTAERSDRMLQHGGISSLEQSGGNENKTTTSSEDNLPGVSGEKRKQSTISSEECKGTESPCSIVPRPQSTLININVTENDNVIHSCRDNQEKIVKTASIAEEEVVTYNPSSKKQKIETRTDAIADTNVTDSKHLLSTPNLHIHDLEDIKEAPCSFEDERISSIARRPKVSIGSTICDGGNSGSEDEMDIMIAQESIWNTGKACDGAKHESNHGIENRQNKRVEDGSDSDIECLGTSTDSQPRDETLYSAGDLYCNSTFHNRDGDRDNIGDEDGSCSSEGVNLVDQEADQDELDTNPQPQSQHNSTKNKDVCYICGSDLTRITTLKGRVAHMKRCSAKYGKVLGGRDAMNNDGDFDADFVATGAEEITVKSPEVTPKHSKVINPYDRSQWHGDASSELKLNKPMSPHSATQPKQSLLKQFFKAPVRSLTNVLMTGARQAAKGKAIIASKNAAVASKSGKQSYKGNWRSSNRRNGSCPAYKRITGTDFICDGFHYATRALSENYFLTHFHSDHYGGITKTWSAGTVYCSLPTANLVHQQLGVDKRYLHPIPMNTPTVIASRGKPVTVTLLDANHCPGAIMFLFEVGNKKILHVGDFRWNRELMMQIPQLSAFSNSSSPRLDEIFFDTTYCNKKYSLPTQEEAISAAIEVAEKEMAISKKDKKMKTLFLFGSYTIGKEKIYISVATHLKMKVYVDRRRYRILSSLEWPKERMQIFTTNKSETSLWVVPLGSVNFKQMRDFLDEGNNNKVFSAPYGRVVGFRPTGWTYSAQDKKQRTLPCGRPRPGKNLISSKTSGGYTVHGVPYSEHSSFPELVDCLRCLKPKKVIPTVSVSKSEQQVELLLNEL